MSTPNFEPHNQTEEGTASAAYPYHLSISLGGEENCTVYFSVTGGELPDEWQVAEGLKVFYKGIDITKLLDGSEVDQQIYWQSNKVEDMVAEQWADAKIEEYEANRD